MSLLEQYIGQALDLEHPEAKKFTDDNPLAIMRDVGDAETEIARAKAKELHQLVDLDPEPAMLAAHRRRGPNPPGLSAAKRLRAKNACVHAAVVGLNHRLGLHYTQRPARWQGIARNLHASAGHWPDYADCSSFATWCIWNGLYVLYKTHDIPNGQHWRDGYTGTLLTHGVRVDGRWPLHRGDLVIYGRGWPGRHVAVYIGGGKVISHGSEGGPYKLPMRYRSDLWQIRRYI